MFEHVGSERDYLFLVDVDETLQDTAHVVVLGVSYQVEYLEHDLTQMRTNNVFHYIR